jgi:hypothetical protein
MASNGRSCGPKRPLKVAFQLNHRLQSLPNLIIGKCLKATVQFVPTLMCLGPCLSATTCSRQCVTPSRGSEVNDLERDIQKERKAKEMKTKSKEDLLKTSKRTLGSVKH